MAAACGRQSRARKRWRSDESRRSSRRSSPCVTAIITPVLTVVTPAVSCVTAIITPVLACVAAIISPVITCVTVGLVAGASIIIVACLRERGLDNHRSLQDRFGLDDEFGLDRELDLDHRFRRRSVTTLRSSDRDSNHLVHRIHRRPGVHQHLERRRHLIELMRPLQPRPVHTERKLTRHRPRRHPRRAPVQTRRLTHHRRRR